MFALVILFSVLAGPSIKKLAKEQEEREQKEKNKPGIIPHAIYAHVNTNTLVKREETY